LKDYLEKTGMDKGYLRVFDFNKTCKSLNEREYPEGKEISVVTV